MTHRIAFVLAATDVGPRILNRMDFSGGDYGPGTILLDEGAYEQKEADVAGVLLLQLRATRGDGVVVIDGGANIGPLTLYWGQGMRDWGTVTAFEPQRFIYYALAGNIALANLFNVTAVHAALSDHTGTIEVPTFDYSRPFCSGSISLLATLPDHSKRAEELRAAATGKESVPAVTIDSLGLDRLDFLKLDIEGMEPAALSGARETIARCKPIVTAEHLICGQQAIKSALPGYTFIDSGINTIGVPNGDAILDRVEFQHSEAA
jgi:FkbM family methyltransferase